MRRLLAIACLAALCMGARTFNGTNQCMKATNNIDLSGSQKASVSLWFYWDAFANDDHLMAEWTSNNNTGNGWIVDHRSRDPGSNVEYP